MCLPQSPLGSWSSHTRWSSLRHCKSTASSHVWMCRCAGGGLLRIASLYACRMHRCEGKLETKLLQTDQRTAGKPFPRPPEPPHLSPPLPPRPPIVPSRPPIYGSLIVNVFNPLYLYLYPNLHTRLSKLWWNINMTRDKRGLRGLLPVAS
jgi:hypothetical protein